MRKYLSLLALPLALLVCACGSSTKVNPQEQASASKAEQTLARCLHNPASLATHNGREALMQCAVPPAHRAAFEQCVIHVVTHGVPTKGRLERGVTSCLEQEA